MKHQPLLTIVTSWNNCIWHLYVTVQASTRGRNPQNTNQRYCPGPTQPVLRHQDALMTGVVQKVQQQQLSQQHESALMIQKPHWSEPMQIQTEDQVWQQNRQIYINYFTVKTLNHTVTIWLAQATWGWFGTVNWHRELILGRKESSALSSVNCERR